MHDGYSTTNAAIPQIVTNLKNRGLCPGMIDSNTGRAVAPSGGGETTFALTVTKGGTGSGTVSSSPSGISCGSTCSASYDSGTSVTLTATAATGSTFAGWSGACSGTSTCTVSMSAAQNVTATFNTSGGGTASCTATYTESVWSSGFTGTVAVKAGSAAINGWTVTLNLNGNTITQVWSATQSGSTFTNLSYNGSLGAGATTSFGFNGSYSGTHTAPTVASCTSP
jgi:hypothetical protein